MKKICIKAFVIMSVLMTVLLILSYMLIGIVFKLLALMVMAAGFVRLLKKLNSDDNSAKNLAFSLIVSVGAMAVSICLSRFFVVGLFSLG